MGVLKLRKRTTVLLLQIVKGLLIVSERVVMNAWSWWLPQVFSSVFFIAEPKNIGPQKEAEIQNQKPRRDGHQDNIIKEVFQNFFFYSLWNYLVILQMKDIVILKNPWYRNSPPNKFENLIDYNWKCAFLYIGSFPKLNLIMKNFYS